MNEIQSTLPQDTAWMKKALELAANAEKINEVPVGAIVVINEKIVGQGFNQTISKHDACAHAEIVAIRDACKTQNNYRIPGATLYVTLEPCSMCLGAMIHARIDRLVFATAEPKAGMIISHPELLKQSFFNHTFSISHGVCHEESSKLIAGFFARRRKEHKELKKLKHLNNNV